MAAQAAERDIRVRARYVAALLPFLSIEPIRHNLRGIFVRPMDPAGVLMIATDGTTLAMIRDMRGVANRPAICAVPDILANSLDGSPADVIGDPDWLYFQGRLVSLTFALAESNQPADINLTSAGTVSTSCEEIDDDFPDVISVFPRPPAQWPFAAPLPPLNTELLEKFGRARHLILNGRQESAPSVSLWRLRDGAPLVVRLEGVPQFVGLVMPMPSKPIRAPYEAWVKALLGIDAPPPVPASQPTAQGDAA